MRRISEKLRMAWTVMEALLLITALWACDLTERLSKGNHD